MISYHALAVTVKVWHALLHWYAILYLNSNAWHAILYLITPCQYPPRLGILFYILSRLGSICQGLACYSIPYYSLTIFAKAWHAIMILYLITPWQCLLRLGMLFCILSLLAILPKTALAVSAEGPTCKNLSYKSSS